MEAFKFRVKAAALGICVVAVSGCASVSYSPSSACTAFGKEVRILVSAPKDGTFRLCGSMSIQGSRFTDPDEANRLFLEQARSHGANAIVVIDALRGSFNWAEGYNKKASAIAIQVSE